MRLIIFKSVVLPLPEDPSTTSSSPACTVRLQPATAGAAAPGNVFDTRSRTMAGSTQCHPVEAAPRRTRRERGRPGAAPRRPPPLPHREPRPSRPPPAPGASANQTNLLQELPGHSRVFPAVAVHFPVEPLGRFVGQVRLNTVQDVRDLRRPLQQLFAHHRRHLV